MAISLYLGSGLHLARGDAAVFFCQQGSVLTSLPRQGEYVLRSLQRNVYFCLLTTSW